MFWRCLYRHALPIAALIYMVNRDFFSEDFRVIKQLGLSRSPEEFRQAMDETPGWEPEDELQAGEVPAEKGRWIYRISTLGDLDGTKVMQNFYLVAGPDGQQVVLSFTMAPKQADRLGSRDLSMAANIDFPK